MDKLLRQLKRDLKKNKLKAAMLGLLCIGAIYSWGNLMFKSDDAALPKPAAAPLAATADPSVPASSFVVSADRLGWRDVARHLSADVRMQSRLPNAGDERRNPFAPVPREEDEAEFDEWIDEVLAAEAEPAAPASFDFDRVSLVLSGTIVGDRVHRAIINGRTFAEGDLVRLKAGGAVRLTSVEPRHVVLEWNGKRRELKIPRPGEVEDVAAMGKADDSL